MSKTFLVSILVGFSLFTNSINFAQAEEVEVDRSHLLTGDGKTVVCSNENSPNVLSSVLLDLEGQLDCNNKESETEKCACISKLAPLPMSTNLKYQFQIEVGFLSHVTTSYKEKTLNDLTNISKILGSYPHASLNPTDLSCLNEEEMNSFISEAKEKVTKGIEDYNGVPPLVRKDFFDQAMNVNKAGLMTVAQREADAKFIKDIAQHLKNEKEKSTPSYLASPSDVLSSSRAPAALESSLSEEPTHVIGQSTSEDFERKEIVSEFFKSKVVDFDKYKDSPMYKAYSQMGTYGRESFEDYFGRLAYGSGMMALGNSSVSSVRLEQMLSSATEKEYIGTFIANECERIKDNVKLATASNYLGGALGESMNLLNKGSSLMLGKNFLSQADEPIDLDSKEGQEAMEALNTVKERYLANLEKNLDGSTEEVKNKIRNDREFAFSRYVCQQVNLTKFLDEAARAITENGDKKNMRQIEDAQVVVSANDRRADEIRAEQAALDIKLSNLTSDRRLLVAQKEQSEARLESLDKTFEGTPEDKEVARANINSALTNINYSLMMLDTEYDLASSKKITNEIELSALESRSLNAVSKFEVPIFALTGGSQPLEPVNLEPRGLVIDNSPLATVNSLGISDAIERNYAPLFIEEDLKLSLVRRTTSEELVFSTPGEEGPGELRTVLTLNDEPPPKAVIVTSTAGRTETTLSTLEEETISSVAGTVERVIDSMAVTDELGKDLIRTPAGKDKQEVEGAHKAVAVDGVITTAMATRAAETLIASGSETFEAVESLEGLNLEIVDHMIRIDPSTRADLAAAGVHRRHPNRKDDERLTAAPAEIKERFDRFMDDRKEAVLATVAAGGLHNNSTFVSGQGGGGGERKTYPTQGRQQQRRVGGKLEPEAVDNEQFAADVAVKAQNMLVERGVIDKSAVVSGDDFIGGNTFGIGNSGSKSAYKEKLKKENKEMRGRVQAQRVDNYLTGQDTAYTISEVDNKKAIEERIDKEISNSKVPIEQELKTTAVPDQKQGPDTVEEEVAALSEPDKEVEQTAAAVEKAVAQARSIGAEKQSTSKGGNGSSFIPTANSNIAAPVSRAPASIEPAYVDYNSGQNIFNDSGVNSFSATPIFPGVDEELYVRIPSFNAPEEFLELPMEKRSSWIAEQLKKAKAEEAVLVLPDGKKLLVKKK